MTFKDWIELIALVVLTISSVVRWIQTRETSDADLAGRVKKLEDCEGVDPADVASLRSGLADLIKRQDGDHRQQRIDREAHNAATGKVAVDVAGQRERIVNLEKRVDRVERRQDHLSGA